MELMVSAALFCGLSFRLDSDYFDRIVGPLGYNMSSTGHHSTFLSGPYDGNIQLSTCSDTLNTNRWLFGLCMCFLISLTTSKKEMIQSTLITEL